MALVREVLTERDGLEPVHTAAEMRLSPIALPGRIRLWTASKAGETVAGVIVYETPVVGPCAVHRPPRPRPRAARG